MSVALYPTERGGGKTAWLIDQTDIDVSNNKHVAIVVPTHSHMRHAEYGVGGWVVVYTEKTFQYARGRLHDHIYVEDANLFENDPADLCSRIAPGVPVTMTYTPNRGRCLPK